MECELLKKINNVPVYGFSFEEKNIHVKTDEFKLVKAFPGFFSYDIVGLNYRAVSIKDWDKIQENGVDVIPTDAPIYCDSLEKAIEYGGWPKIIMGFEPSTMERTFRQVNSGTDKNVLVELERKFPNVAKSKDGKKIWLSRLAMDDPKRSSQYEVAYGWWIPNSPWDSLKLIILAGLDDGHWNISL